MRIAAFAVLAFVASGCTIHVVEQPATPLLVAQAPAPVRPRPIAYEQPAPAPTPRPAPHHVAKPASSGGDSSASSSVDKRVPQVIDKRAPQNNDRPASHNVDKTQLAKPAPRPYRLPFRTLPPESHSPRQASAPKPHRSQRPEPVASLSSARVTQAQ